MTEYRDEKRGLFWSDKAADPLKAIEFATSEGREDEDALVFLCAWRDGDVHEWPEFFEFVSNAEKRPGSTTDETQDTPAEGRSFYGAQPMKGLSE